MTVRGPGARVHVSNEQRTTTKTNAKTNAKTKTVALPTNRATLPVTENDKPADRKFATVTLHPAGHDSAALKLDDVLAAPEPRRETLLWRFVGNAALRAGLALGAAQTRLSSSTTVKRRDVRFESDDARIVRITVDGETRAIDMRAASREDVMFALRAFDRTLLKAGAVDVEVAKLFVPLFGPDGAFVRGPRKARALDERETFATPKLFCWDFNGTVERFDDGRTRAALPKSTAALRRRGGVSVLTTSMRPEDGEVFLDKHAVPFVAHYGNKQVRPTSGHKEYAGVLRAHGVNVDDARHVLAVFGDSKTDAPVDVPGVVFFHNDADTPAPALERVLAELDRRGHGSLHDGLAALVDGLPAVGATKRASVGPIAFAVESRDVGTKDAPCVIPTIHDVRIAFDVAALIATLKRMPPAHKLDERALYRLALEHVADALPLRDVPAVLAGLKGTRGLRAARAAVERRLAWRDEALQRAHEFVGKSDAWTKKALSVDDARRQLRLLVELRDADVAKDAKRIARAIVDDGPSAEEALLASINAHARHLRAHVKKASKVALPLLPNANVDDLAALEKIARNPVPFDAEKQKKQLETVDALLARPLPGSAPILNRILAALDENMPKERKLIRDRFAEREKRADDILAAVNDADAIARAMPEELEAVKKALAAST